MNWILFKRTDGLLFNVPLPGSSGQLGINKNIGEVENKGIELVLNSKILQVKISNGLQI